METFCFHTRFIFVKTLHSVIFILQGNHLRCFFIREYLEIIRGILTAMMANRRNTIIYK